MNAADTITIVGVKDGVESVIGTAPTPPSMKAKEILRNYGFTDFESDDGMDALALAAMEDLIEYCSSYFTLPPEKQFTPINSN